MSTNSKPHIGVPTYIAVLCALLFFTGLTVWVAFQDFGAYNNVIALGIAVIKSTLVVLFFMHVLHSTPLTKMILVTSVMFFLILVTFVYADVWMRTMLHIPGRPPLIGG